MIISLGQLLEALNITIGDLDKDQNMDVFVLAFGEKYRIEEVRFEYNDGEILLLLDE